MAENEKNSELETTAPKKADKAKSEKPSVWKKIGALCKKIGAWFKSVRSECKKVSWAGWKSVRSNSIIVLVCVIIIAVIIGVLDYGFLNAISGLNILF